MTSCAARLLAAAIATVPVAPVAAHPHMFIDAGIEFVFDAEGSLAAIRVGWVYDAFSSMLYFEDFGVDQDYDGILTDEELAILDGFDMNWDEDFDGDAVLLSGGNRVALGRPTEWTTDIADGRIVTTHLRAVPMRPDPVEGLILRIYDPGYYTAYTILDTVRFRGRSDCVAQVWEPDLDRAQGVLAEALDEMLAGGAADVEEDFPAVGAHFAEEIRLRCGPGE